MYRYIMIYQNMELEIGLSMFIPLLYIVFQCFFSSPTITLIYSNISMGVKRVVRRRGFVYVRVCFLLAVFFLRNPQKKKKTHKNTKKR